MLLCSWWCIVHICYKLLAAVKNGITIAGLVRGSKMGPVVQSSDYTSVHSYFWHASIDLQNGSVGGATMPTVISFANTLVQCCLQLSEKVLGKSRKHSILGWSWDTSAPPSCFKYGVVQVHRPGYPRMILWCLSNLYSYFKYGVVQVHRPGYPRMILGYLSNLYSYFKDGVVQFHRPGYPRMILGCPQQPLATSSTE